MNINVYIRADTIYLETVPHDRRRSMTQAFDNNSEGLRRLQADFGRILKDESARLHEAQPIHVFHSEVHKIM